MTEPDDVSRTHADRREQANLSARAPIVPPIRRAAPRINLSVRLGPMVHFEIQGENCTEIADALHGFDRLNRVVDEMFSDLAERIYPDGDAAEGQAA